jgi:hypothetical protein
MWLSGHRGFERCTVSAFCDVVWLALWDDCPALGDQHRYREALIDIFHHGGDAAPATVTDASGKVRRIPRRRGPAQIGGEIPQDALRQLAQMREAIVKARQDKDEGPAE